MPRCCLGCSKTPDGDVEDSLDVVLLEACEKSLKIGFCAPRTARSGDVFEFRFSVLGGPHADVYGPREVRVPPQRVTPGSRMAQEVTDLQPETEYSITINTVVQRLGRVVTGKVEARTANATTALFAGEDWGRPTDAKTGFKDGDYEKGDKAGSPGKGQGANSGSSSSAAPRQNSADDLSTVAPSDMGVADDVAQEADEEEDVGEAFASPEDHRTPQERQQSQQAEAAQRTHTAGTQGGINNGTVCHAKHDVTVFASTTSWQKIGILGAGARVVAAGPPEEVSGYVMVPIRPSGAVERGLLDIPKDAEPESEASSPKGLQGNVFKTEDPGNVFKTEDPGGDTRESVCEEPEPVVREVLGPLRRSAPNCNFCSFLDCWKPSSHRRNPEAAEVVIERPRAEPPKRKFRPYRIPFPGVPVDPSSVGLPHLAAQEAVAGPAEAL